MQQLHNARTGIRVRALVGSVLLLCLGFTLTGTAQAQKIKQAISVAVVPFSDNTGRNSEFVAAKATDAVALALEDSQEYVAAPRADTQREMETLGVFKGESTRVAMSEEQMVRLGERLRVEKIATGSVDELSLEKSTGRCHCVLTLRLLDVGTQEYLDGATADYITKDIPGWRGDQAEVINEALRSAAEVAVEKMQVSRRPRGNIDMVDLNGEILINLGARDGMELGMELLVVRGVWNAAQERVVMRKVGVIAVKLIEPDIAHCYRTSGKTPRTGDKCYVMYRPTSRVKEAARKARVKSYTGIAAAIALLIGIAEIAMGPNSSSAPGVTAVLSQSAPGADPGITVTAHAGNTPGSVKTFGWLIYRGLFSGFPAEAQPGVQPPQANYLVNAETGHEMGPWVDNTIRQVGINFTLTFSYLDQAAAKTTGTLTATYNHVELVPGQTYFYKLRRIVDPGFVKNPLSKQAPALTAVAFTITPPEALSDPSDPAGPVTFFTPPAAQSPANGSTSVDYRTNQTTFEWTPTTGADRYRVILFKSADVSSLPAAMSPELTFLGESTTMRWTLGTNLDAATPYYWVVGARRSGEQPPTCTGVSGWLFSTMRTFTTVNLPPPPVTGSKTTGGKGVRTPPSGTGWWGESRGRH